MVKVKKFGAEVGKVLQLVIHSLYTNKDIFLRELISNASDALDKLRYLSIEDPSLINDDDTELKIQISFDKNNNFVTVKDNGIGMNEKDLINNLGTIANSGTQKFLEALSENPKANVNLIV
jgi:molecular chaperone HtpG